MIYKIWIGLAQTEDEFLLMKANWIPRVRYSEHDALWDAMRINDAQDTENGLQQVVWEIEADNGTRFGRQEVIDLVRRQKRGLIANPPQRS